MIVLDTNVISALMRPNLHSEIVSWLDEQPRASVWTTAINILEARSGIHLLPHGRRREMLNAGFDQLISHLIQGRILPFDQEAAERSAAIADRTPPGRAVSARDIQIAGIVMSRNATLATRHTRDFEGLAIRLLNPWSEGLR